MARLDRESMDAWFGLLPADVASCMDAAEIAGGEAEAARIDAALPALGSGAEVLAYVADNQDSFLSIGRPGRLRFLAWLVAGGYPDRETAMLALSGSDAGGDDGSGGSAGGVGKVAPYFKEDIRALVEAIGPRAARRIVDGGTLAAVTGAAYEVAGELEMRSGGGL